MGKSGILAGRTDPSARETPTMSLDIDQRLLTSLMVLGSVVEARDAYTGGHLWRVGQFSRELAEAMDMSRTEVFLAAVGGFLHDLGKIGVPDAILGKAGGLTAEEFAVIKTHPAIGGSLLAGHPLAAIAVDAVSSHHERPDGTGYPHGIEGEEIPMVARIVGLCDAFDAMTSTRPYRRGMPAEKALSIIEEGDGRQFDAALVEPFLELARAGRLDPFIGHSHHGHRLAECPYCGPIIATHDKQDGTVAPCPACGGEFRFHRQADGFVTEETGRHVAAEALRPQPDLVPIREFVGMAN
jgi:hypothetical protein